MGYVENDANILSRLGSVVSYLTCGWGGLIILVIMYFAKKHISRFFLFNVYQSIIIAFGLFVLGMTWALIFNLLSHVPFIQLLISWVDFIFNRPMLFARSVTELFVSGLILYCAVFSLLGKYPIIYKVSSLIKR